MDMKMLGDGKPFNLPSIIKDPFRTDKVTKMWFYWYASTNEWKGWIEFENGKTQGRQDLIASPTLDGIVSQVKAIIQSINGK